MTSVIQHKLPVRCSNLPVHGMSTSSVFRGGHMSKFYGGRHVKVTSRANHLAVVAFRSAPTRKAASPPPPNRALTVNEHVSVPIDYYLLLQVPRASRLDAVRNSYDHLLKQTPAAAYSADTLFARAVLLKAATESLTDPELRRSYDAKLAAGYSTLRISQQDLPGALVLLQEIGEYNLVLNLGDRWLDLNSTQPDAADVAAAMALSYCDRAGELLMSPDNQGAVLAACDDLEAALGKLRQYGMATQLQSQIVGALRDLAPEYACELVALPLDDPSSASRRAKGVTLIRSLLRSAAAASGVQKAAPSGSGVTSVEGDDGGEESHRVMMHARRMLQRSRDTLMCSEQVSLLPDALRISNLTSPHPDILYDCALATLVYGYRNGWPHVVHKADQLFLQLEQHIPDHAGDCDSSTDGGREGYQTEGVALERAVCNVLLGDYTEAARLLGVDGRQGSSNMAGLGPAAEEQQRESADSADTSTEQLRAFVIEHSPHGTQDTRPGLRALAGCWLEGTALASFRDTAGGLVPPLDKTWFADPWVAVYTQARAVCRNERFLSTLHVLTNLLTNALKLIAMTAERVAAVATLVASRMQRQAPPESSSPSPKTTTTVTAAAAVSHDGSRPHETAENCAGGNHSTACGGGEVTLADAAGNFTVLAGAASGTSLVGAATAAVSTSLGNEHLKPIRHASSVGNTSAYLDVLNSTAATTTTTIHPHIKVFHSYEEEDSTVEVAQQQHRPGAVEAPTRAAREGSSPTLPRRESRPGGDEPWSGLSPVDVRSRFAAAVAHEQLHQEHHNSKASTASTTSPSGAGAAAARPSRETGPYKPVSSHSKAGTQIRTLDGDGEGYQGCGSDEKGDRDEHIHQDNHQLYNPENDRKRDERHVEGVAATDGEWRRHSLSEEELRAHLAGLEAAMWDGGLPKKRLTGQQLAAWAVGAVGILLALVAFFLRHNSGSAPALHVGNSTPAASICNSSGLTGCRWVGAAATTSLTIKPCVVASL